MVFMVTKKNSKAIVDVPREGGGGGVLEEGKGTNDLPEGKRICLRD